MSFLKFSLLLWLPFLFQLFCFALCLFLLFEPTLMKPKRADRVTETLIIIVLHSHKAFLLINERRCFNLAATGERGTFRKFKGNGIDGRDGELGLVANHFVVSRDNKEAHIAEKVIDFPIVCNYLDLRPDIFYNGSGSGRADILHFEDDPSLQTVMNC